MTQNKKSISSRQFTAGIAIILGLGALALISQLETPGLPVFAAEQTFTHEHENPHSDHAEAEPPHTEDEHTHEEATSEHAGEEEQLHLTPEQRARFGIVTRVAGPGNLRNEVALPGEIVFNEDRVAHIVPRVAGIAREVRKSAGDTVTADEILAVIDSRELAEAKAEYLAAHERLGLAQVTFDREKSLWQDKISAEQDYIEARQALAEARIALNSAKQKLHALGLSEDELAALRQDPGSSLSRYTIRAPFAGTIIEKHITLGEALGDDAAAFTIADTSQVWVDLTVHAKNLSAVHTGQEILLQADHSAAQTRSRVTMITPFADRATRSATARVVVDNTDGQWKPGTFVTGYITTDEKTLEVVVARDAVQTIDGRDVVFAAHEDVFEILHVTLGQSDRTHVEVLTGLPAGTLYVTEGAFELKALVVTSQLGGHAGHGH